MGILANEISIRIAAMVVIQPVVHVEPVVYAVRAPSPAGTWCTSYCLFQSGSGVYVAELDLSMTDAATSF